MDRTEEDLIKPGSYVIVQKQSFRKLCKVSEKGTLTLGKDQVEMKGLIGKPYWTTFQMVQSKGSKKLFGLEVADRAESADELRKDLASGVDNRSITDDGTSQMLSKEEIEGLREAGKSSKEIVGRLIENSKSFTAKTEYSQEKYIKKKERKYCRYLSVRKPSIDMLQEIYFKQDYARISCLRMDALAQILSYCDVKAEGTYMLYDSGSMGLPAAAMLSRIGSNTNGTLIHLHPGNQAQTTLIQAMNFPEEQLDRLLPTNLYSFLRLHYRGEEAILEEIAAKSSRSTENQSNGKFNTLARKEPMDLVECVIKEELSFEDIKVEPEEPSELMEFVTPKMEEDNEIPEAITPKMEDRSEPQSVNSLKRKQNDEEAPAIEAKRPKWLLETRRAVDHCKDNKVEGLGIVAKEHPLNIVEALLPFLGASRPFVIYHSYREPLQETYVALKQRRDIINLKLLTNFLRSYQVLPNRTHPDILMKDLAGYMLTGYLVK